jgi:hypothetical protein
MFTLLGLLQEEQAMKDLRLDNVLMQFFNEEFIFDVESLNENDDDINIVRVILTIVVLMILTRFLYDPPNQRLNH